MRICEFYLLLLLAGILTGMMLQNAQFVGNCASNR